MEEVGLSGEDVNLVEVDEEEQLSVKEGMLLSANVTRGTVTELLWYYNIYSSFYIRRWAHWGGW